MIDDTVWKSSNLTWQVGKDTDIGGSRENQDDMFIFERKNINLCIIGVLDGHGRDVGKAAAMAGRDYFLQYFDSHLSELMSDPYSTLVESFKGGHDYIKVAFRRQLEQQGWEIDEAPEGYLLKRKKGASQWACVHGGTSCSIIVLINQKMYIANVGDSSGILCAPGNVLDPKIMQHLGDASLQQEKFKKAGALHTPPPLQTTTPSIGAGSAESASDTLVLTAEHSPECVSEFYRLRDQRPNPSNPHLPDILILYDAPSQDKSKCPQVFDVSKTGIPTVTGKGRYYKNVRQEWASLVSTPSGARFQDALAFTRSLGDFHLHTYGVCHLPEIQVIDIMAIFKDLSALGSSTDNKSYLSIVLSSDGVWDNFVYSDVTRFVMDSTCINAVKQEVIGAQRVASSFMQRNVSRSRANFGSQADNATCIIMYLTSTAAPSFPVEGFSESMEVEKLTG